MHNILALPFNNISKDFFIRYFFQPLELVSKKIKPSNAYYRFKLYNILRDISNLN